MMFLTALIPLIPQMIKGGLATYEIYSKVKTMADEDRSLTPEERAQLEKMITEAQAVVRDTSRDV